MDAECNAQRIARTDKDASKLKIDVIAISAVAAALVLFIGSTSTQIIPAVIDALRGKGPGPGLWILNASLLNVAVILFGWSRYRQLCAEIAEGRAAEHAAQRLAHLDPLTGYLNRRGFHGMVDELCASASRAGKAVVLMMIDIDNFKQVNDQNGHMIGDLLLSECARRMKSALPHGALIGRVGGDEFAAAFAFDPQQPEYADFMVAKLMDAVRQDAQFGSLSMGVTASIGLARSHTPRPDHGPAGSTDARDEAAAKDEAVGLFERADLAMYQAKDHGRNRYYWFEPQMARDTQLRSEFENSIREGVTNGEFVPFYERQIDLSTGELSGYEMLARWDSPHFGIVSPEVFIPVAEAIGAIAELSESLIAQALAEARQWQPHLTLAVNISPIQLRDPCFAQKLLRMLVEANFPPSRLEIEITESCLHNDLDQVRAQVVSLKNQGIRVSLDDFGTGYSSIAQLRSLPFDRIKIDRSFVSSALNSKDSMAIVHCIAMLGKGLNLPITAEGIESGEILAHLRQYGAMTGQGYLYGRPCRADELRHDVAPIRPRPETASYASDSFAPIRAHG